MTNHYMMKHLVGGLNHEANALLVERIQETKGGWLAMGSEGTPLSFDGNPIVYENPIDAFVALKNDADKFSIVPCNVALIKAVETLSHFEKILFDSIWHECLPIETGEMMNIELDIPTPYYEVAGYASQIMTVVRKIENGFRFSGSNLASDETLHSKSVRIDVEFRKTTVMLTIIAGK